MNAIHFRNDPPAAGAWNMAVDEMLLQRAAEQGIATLRFYQWSPATLSLGYFQHAEDRESHAASRSCPLVRRSSGGGAILHDRELTYSLSLPMSHPLAADPETLYRETHGSLVRTLADFGITATLNEQTLVGLGGEPFLCFQRRSVGDVVVGAHKVCGSAQRRNKGAILQHGSVLLAASPYAPELPGLTDLAAQPIDVAQLLDVWLVGWRRLTASHNVVPAETSRTFEPADARRIETILREKYGAESWTNRR